MIKSIFIGIYCFGYLHTGCQIETKIFDRFEDCSDFQVSMTEFVKVSGLVQHWELTCHTPTVNGDTGSVTVKSD